MHGNIAKVQCNENEKVIATRTVEGPNGRVPGSKCMVILHSREMGESLYSLVLM